MRQNKKKLKILRDNDDVPLSMIIHKKWKGVMWEERWRRGVKKKHNEAGGCKDYEKMK